MTGELRKTSLENIADGAAVELFDHELQRIARNIQDPNTKATAALRTYCEKFLTDNKVQDVAVL